MRKLLLLALVGVIAAVAAIVGYSSSANATSAAATPLPSSACGPVFYKGKGSRSS